MADHPGSWKICATCVFWIARRDTDTFGSRVINCDNQGRCAVPCGPWRNTQRTANGSACNCYQKWPVLR